LAAVVIVGTGAGSRSTATCARDLGDSDCRNYMKTPAEVAQGMSSGESCAFDVMPWANSETCTLLIVMLEKSGSLRSATYVTRIAAEELFGRPVFTGDSMRRTTDRFVRAGNRARSTARILSCIWVLTFSLVQGARAELIAGFANRGEDPRSFPEQVVVESRITGTVLVTSDPLATRQIKW